MTYRWRCVFAGIAIEAVVILLALLISVERAPAQEHHHPAETITGAAAKFYETWFQPDAPSISCCSQQDCYATPSRHRSGKVQALHRESGEWIDIPPKKIELNRDSPDGQSHLFAAPWGHVFCFKEGGGT